MEIDRLSWKWLTRKKFIQWCLFVILGLSTSLFFACLPAIAASPIAPLASLSWQGWVSIGITIGLFLLNALSSIPAEIVFLGGAAVLFVSGILDEKTALSGFSNSGMITVGVLYIVVSGLEQTGGLTWISQNLLGLPKGEKRALLRLMLPVMGISAFLNNTPVVAMFIPVVSDWCRKLGISPSKLMLPLSYAAIFGGVCTLIGTSTNLVVNGLLIDATDLPGMKLFDLAWVGIPCALAGTAYLLFFGRWVLPNRQPVIEGNDRGSFTLQMMEYTTETIVSVNSPLIGKSVEQAGLRNLPDLYLAEIVRDNVAIPAVGSTEILQEKDRLVFIGAVNSIVDLQRMPGLEPATDEVFKLDAPRSERSLIEAVVSNSCPLVGKTIREGKFRNVYNAVVLAVARNGERLKGKIGNIRLQAGDTLLLEAPTSFISQQGLSTDFYLINGIPDSEPLRTEKAPLALGILLLMVGLATFDVMSMLQAAVLASILILVTRCCSGIKALRNIEWSVLLVIAAALAIGKALESTGAAQAVADTLIGFAGDNPWTALVIIYAITTMLTEVITNNAAAALIFPIALALSKNLGVDVMPFVIAITIGASASFSTPIGYQTNMMVYGPGGYKFTDFMRVGIPLNILFLIVTVTIVPIIFPFNP
jgi:di/tricarboxylate transporter